MAETSNTDKNRPSLLVKHVQELAINGDEPPQRYVHKDRDNEAPVDTSLSSSVPIIDLHLISSPTSSTQQKQDEIEKLKSALTSWGLFQAIGHGISSSLLDDLRKMAREFFDLPINEKRRYATNKDGANDNYFQGYGNDPVVSEEQTIDWNDRLYLLLKPEDERNLKLWPENPSHFREVLKEFSSRSDMLIEFVLKVMAVSLGLEDDYFLNHANEEVEGLQVFKDGKWIKVPVVPNAIIINVADQIEIISNGVYKSPVHRVITNSEKERLSLAVFYSPEMDKEIEPATKFITESMPRMFRKIKMKDYYEAFVLNTFRGARGIDWARV
ncbi:hypothetical protein Sjap_006283 [Stephania japonica]|uniref:Fe2OG dioxygenase domain-containing protein n=1 Tax=Stephania japonica TaxID=461633 RepID=A0AAP0PLU7_9MAGN